MKSQLSSRLKTDLFPETPESFRNRIHNTLRTVGVKPRTIRPWEIAATAVCAASVAAALILVLLGTFRNPDHGAALPGTEASNEPTTVAQRTIESPEPDENTVSSQMPDPGENTVSDATEEPLEPTPQPQNGDEPSVLPPSLMNLSVYSDETVASYGTAVIDALKSRGVHFHETIWICGVMPLAFPEEAPTDRAYVLAQYTFDGETGPELFFYRDGKIEWMTQGYDPFRINTVFDASQNLIVVFGASFAYDNGPIEMREGKVKLTDGTEETFQAQLPLPDMKKLGLPEEWTSEYYLCAFSAKQSLKSIEIIAKDGHIFFPFDETENRLLDLVVVP